MKSFIWNSNYEVGISDIDRQHQCLVDIINDYSSLLANDQANDAEINATLERLVNYTKHHFVEEEALMVEYSLDQRHFIPHQKQHQELLNEISILISDRSSNKTTVGKYILELIIHWLAYHILGTDVNMAKQMSAIDSGSSPSQAFDEEERAKDKSTQPLLEALHGLFSQVNQRNKQLLELNSNLETKIAKRTQALSEANAHLSKLSLTDPLTQMHNRRYAMRQLKLLWQESIAKSEHLTCLMIDVDDFKQVNDRFGHQVGDEYLTTLAKIFNHHIRSDDIACRLGGDEFLIICPNTSLDGGMILANAIEDKVNEQQISPQTPTIFGSISVGVSTNSLGVESFEQLIKIADEGVYQAKHDGRKCVRSKQKEQSVASAV